MTEEASGGADRPSAEGPQVAARKERVWRQLRLVGLATLCALTAGTLLPELLPKAWTGWGLRLSISSDEPGLVQVYYVTGEGWFEEASSVSVEVPAASPGKTRVVFLPLPDEPILRLRVDPIDREGPFRMAPPVLVGPWQRELEADRFAFDAAKGREGIEDVEGGAEQAFRSTGSDPWWYYDVRKPPLQPPHGAFRLNRVVFALVGGVLGWIFFGLALSRRSSPVVDRVVEEKRGRGLVVGVILFYVLLFFAGKGPVVPAFWFWGLVVPGLAAGVLLGTPKAPGGDVLHRGIRQWARLPSVVGLAGFALLFGIYAARMPADSIPPRGDVLAAVVIFPFLTLCFSWFWTRAEELEKLLRWPLIIAILVGSVFATWHLGRFYAPDWQIHKRLIDPQNFPLYRPISGSACFAVLLLLSLMVPMSGSFVRSALLRFIFGLPLMLWTVLAQSRGVLLTVLALLLLLAFSTKKREVWLVSGLYLVMAVLFVATPLPHWIGKRNASPDKVEDKIAAVAEEGVMEPAGTARAGESEAQLETAATEGVSKKRKRVRMLKPVKARPRIYQTYLSASLQKPILGHGFSGEQTLVVSLPDVREELREQRWNPHSVHLSVLYFGGIVGLFFHALLLGGTVLALFQRFRRRGDAVARGLILLVLLAVGCVTFESTLVAGAKEAVILWRPNEYWLFYWLPICAAVGYLIACTGWERREAGGESGCSPQDPRPS